MVATVSDDRVIRDDVAERRLAERAQIVDVRRLRERALRVHATMSWLMPLQAIVAVGSAWTNGPDDLIAFGLRRWLIVGIIAPIVAVVAGAITARATGNRRSRIAIAVCQFAMYGVMQIAGGGPVQVQVNEYVSLALLSLYHDPAVMLMGMLLMAAFDSIGYTCVALWGNPQSISWNVFAAQTVGAEIATGLYVAWDRREQRGAVEREAQLELETERRKTIAEELRHTAARYRRVVDSNLIGICFWDGTGQVVDANDAYLALLGYDRRDLESGLLKHESLTPPEWRPVTNTTLLEIRQRGFAAPTEKEYVRKDGTRIQVLRGSAAVEGANVGVSFVLDLREMKRLERDLNAVLQANIIGVVFWDSERWTDANDAFLEMIGYNRNDLQTTNVRVSSLLAPGSSHTLAEIRREMDATGRFQLREMELRHRDAHRVPVLMAGVRLNRHQVHGVAFVLNMTRQKAVERELATARDELELRVQQRTEQLAAANEALSLAKDTAESANRAKSQFLANMSHEIRTPMTAIQGFAELMQDPELADSERRAYANTIRRNSDHLLRLLDDVLDLSRIEADRMQLATERTPLVPLLQDVMELMQARAAAKGLVLRLRVATAVPTWIVVDPLRLRQVLLNLVGNAVKFTERGEITVSVAMQAAAEGRSQVLIAVADTGIGIADEEMTRLFQPFAQADPSTTRRFGGSGLGLAISRRLASLMGGELTAESDAGQGSVFTLRIDPGGIAESPLETLPEQLIGGATEPVRIKSDNFRPRIQVLLAEDGVDNQLLITTYLRHAGIGVTVAQDGRAAIAEAMQREQAGSPFALVLMDMQMPGIDGYEATRVLRAQNFTQPIIALTAHAMAGDREQCLEAGCTDYVAKPLSRAALLAAIRRNLPPDEPGKASELAPVVVEH
jgi:PAS domain S-box-containing protein